MSATLGRDPACTPPPLIAANLPAISGLRMLRERGGTVVVGTDAGINTRKGRLAPGYDADILAVGGDPLTTPDALRDVRGVWRGGRLVAGSRLYTGSSGSHRYEEIT